MNYEKLQHRLKIVRNSYMLPIGDVAIMTGTISKTGLTDWESGRRVPTIDNLYSFALIFGVSVDWLCGMSDSPYTSSSITAAEDAFPITSDVLMHYASFSDIHLNDISSKDIKIAVNKYLNPQKRESYLLDARANIILFMHYVLMFSSPTTDNEGNVMVRYFTASQFARVKNYCTALKATLVWGSPAIPLRIH